MNRHKEFNRAFVRILRNDSQSKQSIVICFGETLLENS